MVSTVSNPAKGRCLSACFLFFFLTLPVLAHGQPSFSLVYLPDTIGPGSTATLQFMIGNAAGVPATDLAFTDTLPAGVTIAAPAQATSECGGTLNAPEGGGTVTFTQGTVGPATTCTVKVDVTSGTPGIHTNVTGDLTSSAGNSGTASGDLTVDTARPGFSKSFSPSSLPLGGRSTLTFTVDNAANPTNMFNITFTDSLPAGIVVADPPSTLTTCSGTLDDSLFGSVSVTGGVLTAQAGSNVIVYGSGGGFNTSGVAAGTACTVTVDVTAAGGGTVGNTTGLLTASASSVYGGTLTSGMAADVLEVTVDQLHLIKSFAGDPVPPGGTVDLEFTIANFDRNAAATNISFSDDLDATLSGLAAIGLPLADVCGTGSLLSGTSQLILTGGGLAPMESCTFSVTLQVPPGAVPGQYPNTTSGLTADLDGVPIVSGPAAEDLFVYPVPVLTKDFLDDPIGTGGTTRLEFTITNTSLTSDATDISFVDELTTFLPFPVSASLPAAGFCGPDATMSLASLGTDRQGLSMAGGSLAPLGQPGDSCTFTVDIDIPVGMASGTYVNTTDQITAMVDNLSLSGSTASDSLTIAGAPRLTKSFADDPVLPGDTVTLEFTLIHDESAPGDAVDIAFTDDLGSLLPGLAATGLPANDICGAGSQISGTDTLSLTGGTLAPGGSCTFAVSLQVPSGDDSYGIHTNSTSSVAAAVNGVQTLGNPAQDDLLITPLVFAKLFTNDPVIPGDTVNLEFTLTNSSPTASVSNISFTDDLDAALEGLIAVALPLNDVCGTGSTITTIVGAGYLQFSGGSLGSASSCTFSVPLLVPGSAASGSYINSTSSLQMNIDGVLEPTGAPKVFLVDPAVDDLTVDANLLQLSKSFTDDPALPGGTVNLAFTLTNHHATQSASAITFTDDLEAALAGLAANGLPVNDICGPGSQISGTGILTFTGGTLAPGASCTFSVELQVPAGLSSGTMALSTTSQVTGAINSLPVTGSPAADTLEIGFLTFAKAFSGKTKAGSTVTLDFTIQNNNPVSGVTDLQFSDVLTGMFPGLAATGLPAGNVCGAGSLLSGSEIITLAGANLGSGELCTFSVDLSVPMSAPHGLFENVTSSLTIQGEPVAGPASATLEVDNDADDDGVMDQADNCPNTVNADQADNDRDGLGDVCDPDDDNDGVADTADNCPLTPNASQSDLDGDGKGDSCDTDRDNDGMPDAWENANGLNPSDPGDADGDNDGDGFTNLEEYEFGSDPNTPDADTNNNGVPDSIDSRRGALPPVFHLLSHP